ncbi:Uncharacterized protein MSYG_1373 [Malassezia sympodialis ATCC 42132]|uniref:Uncharacterized protein n=1 Tax=Malassezia sympodialis (strain ATCC 42132) TaxID=1230383 RepID=A0A1M8A3K3_MALS4|nr:Uncharacterized protein MSYG_1373 [Malassezia sympodialis ATCC 42132]
MDVPLAVGIGLVASFVQSLGLTVQRRSHLQNESLPEDMRKSEWRRPLWIIGFVVFLGANISGTIFQIGSLPVVILAPLGAVSLLYNALLARVMLNDFFSRHMLMGTMLIAVGAVVIGYFGAVSHTARSLPELLRLFQRPPFVMLATLFALVFLSMLCMAHLTEWQLVWQHKNPSRWKSGRTRGRAYMRRHRTAPALATVAEVSENNSGISQVAPSVPSDDRLRRLVSGDVAATKRMHGTLPSNPHVSQPIHYGSITRSTMSLRQPSPSPTPSDASTQSWIHRPSHRPTVLALAVIYSASSGTLSGVCLLLAKSGVDLLILSLQGQNQFSSWTSWWLVIILLVAALLQLCYLHKSLKLADPVLVAPLAFCFYNISSITLGLVYFDDLSLLSWTSVLMVVLGTCLLLCGVWTISLHRMPSSTDEEDSRQEDLCWGPGWHDAAPISPIRDEERMPLRGETEHVATNTQSTLDLSTPRRPSTWTPRDAGARSSSIELDHALTEGIYSSDQAHTKRTCGPTLYDILVERGLSIGLSPSSPGFHVQTRRRMTGPAAPQDS